MIICAGNNETFKFARAMGVGLVESAINMTRQCLFDKPEFILFIGSAGSYGNHNIFDIVESNTAANLELSFLENNSYTPLDNVLKSDNKLVQNQTIVNSSNYITTNSDLAKKYNDYYIGIENMEFFSLVQVAKEFNINIGGIFVVTNYTNENAHQDFISNHIEAKEKLTQYLIQKNIIK